MSAGLPAIVSSKALGAGVALVLTALLLARAVAAFPAQYGIDFYQFWGVPLAKRVAAPARSPYVDPPAYARVLNEISDASPSRKLREANRYRRNLEPMGTPFLYAIFASFPDDYDKAQALFTAILYAAAAGALFVLARLRGVAPWPALCIALLVELTFRPFLVDVTVANLNSLQLAFMAALLSVAVRRRFTGRALVDGLFIGLLAVLVILKPNTPWIALAFALHYAATQGARRLAAAIGAAALLAAMALGAGAWFFHDAGVWGEWLRYARGMDGSALALTLDQGNLSLAMLWARHSAPFGAFGCGIAIAGALGLALVAAMASGERGPGQLAATAKRVFANPWLAASLGVVFTFASSPLVWPHYQVLALLPIFWLAGSRPGADAGAWGALICYIALSGPFFDLLAWIGSVAIIKATLLLAWLALVPGIFARVAAVRRDVHAAA